MSKTDRHLLRQNVCKDLSNLNKHLFLLSLKTKRK